MSEQRWSIGTPPVEVHWHLTGCTSPDCGIDRYDPARAAALAEREALDVERHWNADVQWWRTEQERVRAAGKVLQVATAEAAWELGRDHPLFDRLMSAVTRHQSALAETPEAEL